jgi:uncharacterized protein (DUF1330 family)
MTTAVPSEAAGPYYLIFDGEVHDSVRYQDYVERVLPLIESAGGRFLVRGGACHVYEGDGNSSRIVVLEFPSKQAWDSFYFSEAYGPIKEIRHEAAAGRLVGVEGAAQAAGSGRCRAG